jgi:hypothetical protein
VRSSTKAALTWPSVPPEVAELLLPGLDSVAEEIIEAIRRGVPEYARPLDDSYTKVLRQAVWYCVHQFVDRIADPAAPCEETAKLFLDIGRTEAAEGRSLEALQTALRLGARVGWQRLHERAQQDSIDIEVFAHVGEAIFLYLDELAAACSAGYALAKAELVGERERRRSRLLDLIVADPPTAPTAVADLARAADWALPRKVAAVALADRPGDSVGSVPSLPPDVLIDMSGRDPFLLMPDPDGPGRARLLERGLRGWSAAVGPAVPLGLASRSLRWARQTLALTQRGITEGTDGLVLCTDHMSTLVILSDEELVRTLGGRVLAPLRKLRPDQQDRLAETLLAWLQSADNAGAAAHRLHVHPQTVRYRLRQIAELFGDALQDPGARLELLIALQARQLLSSTAAGNGRKPALNGRAISLPAARPPSA